MRWISAGVTPGSSRLPPRCAFGRIARPSPLDCARGNPEPVEGSRPCAATMAPRAVTSSATNARARETLMITAPIIGSVSGVRQLYLQEPLQLAELRVVQMRHRVLGAAARREARFARSVHADVVGQIRNERERRIRHFAERFARRRRR